MAEIVAFDTMICVWGLKKIADRDNMISRCSALINDLDKRHATILIPAPVLGEILAPVPPGEYPDIFNTITNIMRVQSFDVLAAEAYAEMLYKYNNNLHAEDLKVYAKSGFIPRQKVKMDYMIAAIAYSNKADCLYTDDNDLRKFTSPFLEVRSIPRKTLVLPTEIPQQISLFDLVNKQSNEPG